MEENGKQINITTMMDPVVISLKLFLEELGIPASISTVDERKTIQKAIYLGQLTGADLGYRFGWYVKGPYSIVLTRDYYKLETAILSGDKTLDKFVLDNAYRRKLKKIRNLMKPPKDTELKQHEWLELLASYDYLKRVSKYNERRTINLLKKLKSHLYSPKSIIKVKKALTDYSLA